MGRGILLIAFFVTVFHLVPAVTAVAVECRGDQMRCWVTSPRGESREVTIEHWLFLEDEDRHALQEADKHAKLTVSVPDIVSTGLGGTVLFVLAEERTVGPRSVVTALDEPAVVDTLRKSRACAARCQEAVDLLETGRRTGQELIDEGAAEKLGTERGGNSLLLRLTAGAATALVLLVALLALAVRRTRVSPALAVAGSGSTPGPRHRAASRPSPPVRLHREPDTPRRTAAVRTPLRPQGYVEVDHCLYRAEWADADAQPPDPGALVDVADPAGAPGDADLLIALPRSRHRRAADDHI